MPYATLSAVAHRLRIQYQVYKLSFWWTLTEFLSWTGHQLRTVSAVSGTAQVIYRKELSDDINKIINFIFFII